MLKVLVKESRNIKKIFKRPSLYQKFAKNVAKEIRKGFVQYTPVDTGDAKRSWTPVQRTAKGYSFGNTKMYTKFLVSGSNLGSLPWPSPGPRTVVVSGRVYSSQAPGGINKQVNIELVVQKAMDKFITGMRR